MGRSAMLPEPALWDSLRNQRKTWRVIAQNAPVAATDRPCPNCGAQDFAAGRCERCGRPRLNGGEYLDEIEALAWAVVNEAHEHYVDLRATADSGPELQRAIVRLADRLRHYHFDGDGCVDDEDEA